MIEERPTEVLEWPLPHSESVFARIGFRCRCCFSPWSGWMGIAELSSATSSRWLMAAISRVWSSLLILVTDSSSIYPSLRSSFSSWMNIWGWTAKSFHALLLLIFIVETFHITGREILLPLLCVSLGWLRGSSRICSLVKIDIPINYRQVYLWRMVKAKFIKSNGTASKREPAEDLPLEHPLMWVWKSAFEWVFAHPLSFRYPSESFDFWFIRRYRN